MFFTHDRDLCADETLHARGKCPIQTVARREATQHAVTHQDRETELEIGDILAFRQAGYRTAVWVAELHKVGADHLTVVFRDRSDGRRVPGIESRFHFRGIGNDRSLSSEALTQELPLLHEGLVGLRQLGDRVGGNLLAHSKLYGDEDQAEEEQGNHRKGNEELVP